MDVAQAELGADRILAHLDRRIGGADLGERRADVDVGQGGEPSGAPSDAYQPTSAPVSNRKSTFDPQSSTTRSVSAQPSRVGWRPWSPVRTRLTSASAMPNGSFRAVPPSGCAGVKPSPSSTASVGGAVGVPAGVGASAGGVAGSEQATTTNRAAAAKAIWRLVTR